MKEKLFILFFVLYVKVTSCQSRQEDHDLNLILQRLEIVETKVQFLERENQDLREENRRINIILDKYNKQSESNIPLRASTITFATNETSNGNTKYGTANNNTVFNARDISRVFTAKEKIKKRLLLESTTPSTTPRIAFFAGLKYNIDNLGSHQPVDYKEVMLNEGNAYDPQHGHFTAPVKGMYLLSASITVNPGKRVALDMVRNSQRISVFFADSSLGGFYSTQSRSFPIILEKGDTVWLRTYPGYESQQLVAYNANHYYNSFSGVLLYPF